MANVPTLHAPTVELETVPQPYQRLDVPITAFGGREAEQLQQAVGVGVKLKTLADENDANDALNQFRADNLKANTDFLGKQGKDAVDAHDAYVSDLNTRKQQIMSNLGANAQRMARSHIEGVFGNAMEAGEAHFRKQQAQWSIDSTSATLDTNLKDGINSRNDPVKLQGLLEHSYGEFDKLRPIFGWDEATTASKKAAWSTRFYASVVDSYLNEGKVNEAKKLLGAVGDQLDPATLGAMKNKTQVIGERIEARQRVMQIDAKNKAVEDLQIARKGADAAFAKGDVVDTPSIMAKAAKSSMSKEELQTLQQYLDQGNGKSLAYQNQIGVPFVDQQILADASQRAADNAKNKTSKPVLFMTNDQARGLLEPGNIELRTQFNAPNADEMGGSKRAGVFAVADYYVVLPTVDGDGKRLNFDETLEQYKAGDLRHYGKFDNKEHAEAYLKDLSYQQGQHAKGVTSPEALQAQADAQKFSYQKHQENFVKRPLGYLFDTSPSLKGIYADADKANTPEAWDRYFTAVENRYKQLLPNADITGLPLLPDQHASKIVNNVTNKYGADLMLELDRLRATLGDDRYSKVLPQLVQAGMPDEALVGGQIGNPDAKKAFGNAINPEARKANLRDIDPDKRKLADGAIDESLRGFKLTVYDSDGVGRTLIAQQRRAIRTLAYDYIVNRGDDPVEAGKKAYKDILGDKYVFSGHWRLPVSDNGPTLSDMNMAMQLKAEDLKGVNFDIPNTPIWEAYVKKYGREYVQNYVNHAATSAALSRNGWYSNNQDNGVQLQFVGMDNGSAWQATVKGQPVNIFFSHIPRGFTNQYIINAYPDGTTMPPVKIR